MLCGPTKVDRSILWYSLPDLGRRVVVGCRINLKKHIYISVNNNINFNTLYELGVSNFRDQQTKTFCQAYLRSVASEELWEDNDNVSI